VAKKISVRPDYSSMERPWDEFTDDELSMIASHLAGGGAFCCEQHRFERATVTPSRRKQHILADQAYDRWGCASPDTIARMEARFGAAYTQERRDTEIAHYLGKFLAMI